MPRYCDACRTFITSRDSLTRNAHPTLTRHRNQRVRTRPFWRMNSVGRGLAHVMSSRLPDRQALLFRSCPKNIGNLRQLTWYSRQVPQYIGTAVSDWPYILRFSLNSPLSSRTVILCVHLEWSHRFARFFALPQSGEFGSANSTKCRGSSTDHRPWREFSRPSQFHRATAA